MTVDLESESRGERGRDLPDPAMPHHPRIVGPEDESAWRGLPVGATAGTYERIVAWQHQVIAITNRLLSHRSETIDIAIDDALEQMGRLAGVDRTYVFRMREPDRLDNTHEWTAPGIEPMIGALQDQPADLLDHWRMELDANRCIQIPDVSRLPPCSPVREVLEMQGIRSLLIAPILRDGRLAGFVGFDAVRTLRAFTAAEVELLQSVANAIGSCVHRALAEDVARSAIAQLSAERSRLEATLAAVPDLVVALDKDQRISAVHAGACCATPPAFRGAAGRPLGDVLPPPAAATIRAILDEADRDGQSARYECALDGDGGTCWYEVSAAARGQRDVVGRGHVLVLRDITGTRNQQRQIRRLSRIAELTSNFVIVTDAEGRIDWVNPAFERRSGWSLDEIRGQIPGTLLRSAGTDRQVSRRIGAALHDGHPIRTEIVNQTRSGEEYWVSKDIQPLLDETGAIEGFVSVQTDITALQQERQRALQVQAQAMNASSDGIAIIAPGGRYIYVNPAYREMLGIGCDTTLDQLDWPAHFAAFAQDKVSPEATAALQPQGSWNGPMKTTARDGSAIELDVAISVTDNGGRICIARDVTVQHEMEAEQQRLRDELQLAQRRETVAQVAAAVAHDLNNLVAVVSSTVVLLEQPDLSAEELAGGLDRITCAMDAAADIVAGLVQTGRPNTARTALDFRAILAETTTLLGSQRVRRHRITCTLPEPPPRIWADRTEILQVLLNVTLNACESGENSTVVLSVLPADAAIPDKAPDIGWLEDDKRFVLFSVQDDGSGISPGIRSKVFDRYQTTKGDAGTGLGLPIVAEIVNANGGAVWLETSEGKGTKVLIAWPEAAAAAPAPLPADRS